MAADGVSPAHIHPNKIHLARQTEDKLVTLCGRVFMAKDTDSCCQEDWLEKTCIVCDGLFGFEPSGRRR